jgi:hypothetical protein
MASSNTYFIDVNSNYRDVNRYPNPCDFGITFQTNQSTGNFSNGLPVDNNSFYNKGSIDPDFLNKNIRLENCIIDNFKQDTSNNSIYYVCGSTVADNLLNVYYKNNLTDTFPRLTTGSNSPFLMKFDSSIVIDDAAFRWGIYIDVSSVNYTNISSRSTFQFDSNGNLIYEFDFSGEGISVYRIDNNSNISKLLDVTNPKGKKICQCILKIDSDGNLGLYDGRNWGYHILSSNFDTKGSIDNVGQFSVTVDSSDNIITTVNTTPYTNTPDVTIIPNDLPDLTSVYSLPYFTPYGAYQKSYNGRDIFMYCTSVAQSQQGSITGAINFVDNNSTGPFILGSSRLTYPTVRNLSEIFDFQFIECNDKLYGVSITYLITNSAASQTGYFYGINYTGGYEVNMLAPLPVRTDYKISAVSVGTNIYIFSWSTIDRYLYCFKYDTITNTMSTFASYLLPISNPSVVRHVWPKCWTDGTDVYIIVLEFNSNNSTTFGDVNIYGMKLVIATSTLSIEDTVIYPKRGAADMYVFDNSVSKYCVFSSLADTELYILDVSDITNLQIKTATVNTSGFISFYSVNAGSSIKYFLGLCARTSNVTYFYDVSDIDNITLINSLSTYTDPVYQNTNSLIYIDSDNILLFSGVLTGNRTDFATVFSKYPSNFTTTILDSTHYDYNISKYLDIPTSSMTGPQMFSMIETSDKMYVVSADEGDIYFYNVTDIIGSSLVYSTGYAFNSVPSDIVTEVFEDKHYIGISSSNQCDIFSVGPIATNNDIYSTFQYITSVSISTGSIRQSFLKTINNTLRLLISGSDAVLYSYVYPSFNISQTFDYSNYNIYNGGFINYFPANDEYILTTFTVSGEVPVFGQLLPYTYTGTINAININNPTGMYVASTKSNLFQPQSKMAITPFYFDNTSYMFLSFDYSTTNSIQRTSGQVWNIDDYDNYSFVGGISNYYTNYYYLKPNSCIVTANDSYVVFSQNSATGYTGPFPPATGGLIYPTDTIYFERFDGTSVFGNISTVQTDGNVLQLKTITFNNKITLICLLNTGKLYLYDVTEPIFSASNQNLVSTTVNNVAGINFGNAFISKILSDGTPSYSSFLGSKITDNVISQYVNLTNTVIDTSTNQYLYIVGNWTDSIQFYSTTSTGSYVLDTRLVKDGFAGNAVLFQMRLSDGVFGWCLPCLGDNEDYFTKLQYTDNSLYICGYSYSSNFNIYNVLSGLSSSFPSTLQYILTTYSFGSGFILKFSTSGTYRYNIIIYSLQNSAYVKVLDVSVNSEGILCCGISNSNTIKCLDTTLTNTQDLFSDSNIITDINAITYKFDLSGNYISSNNVKIPTTNVFFRDVKQYISNNTIYSSISLITNRTNSKLYIYHKDGSLASDDSTVLNRYEGYILKYKYDSSYTNSSGQTFSQLVMKDNPPFSFIENEYQEHKVFIQGNSEDTTVNKNFSIRENYIENYYNVSPYFEGVSTGSYVFLLNDFIPVKNMVRSYSSINNITGSSDYLNFNLSSSNLGCVITYGAIYTGAYNFVNTAKVYGSLSTTEQQYFLLPTSTGTRVVRITSAEYISENVYSLFVDDINSLKVNGIFYGPDLYVGRINRSVYYNLQFFPGSIVYPTYFSISILSITIPNRPLTNLSTLYGGQRTINDLPYIYVSIYNANDNDDFDPAIVNIVYDNTVLNTRPQPQYLIPVSNQSSANNFATFTSNYSPLVKFSPGYYNLRVKIMDNEGNILIFDPSATKTSDTTFTQGKAPDYLMNVYLRLSAKKA